MDLEGVGVGNKGISVYIMLISVGWRNPKESYQKEQRSRQARYDPPTRMAGSFAFVASSWRGTADKGNVDADKSSWYGVPVVPT